ncbi:MAG: M14 family zinc carboxypeptidase [Solirubrobacterales bacterium]
MSKGLAGRLSKVVVATGLIGLTGFATSASAAPAKLQMYEASANAAQLGELVAAGYDIAAVEEGARRVTVDLVLSARQRNELRKQGLEVAKLRDRNGRTVTQRAARQARNGFNVYRDFDSEGGIRDELYRFARQNRALARLHVLGESHEGREIIAIQLTQGRKGQMGSGKPAVLYQGTAHAREWISTEVSRRLMHWYADRWPRDPEIRRLLKETELWFIPVVNPDGYQYTFDTERLWRKNLRDNDGDGQITGLDGVDLNRNFPEHWNYDDEGSSSQLSSETYRGPEPASEPETQANIAIFDQIDFEFAISYHSFGQLLLYPQGWQVQTPSADDPIYVALTGTDDEPAVEGFDPDVSAELYITNGEFTDWAHGERDVLAWTPELSEGCDGCGFVFPDDEQLVQEEFEKNIEFALNVAKSADDPDDPASHFGLETEPFYLDISEIDPFKANNPLSDLTFDVSHSGGAAQPVEVLAQRALGEVTLHYSINGGAEQTAGTAESPEGEAFGGNNAYDAHYHYLRGEVTGANVGDSVEVWFEGGGAESDRFTYEVVEDAGAEALILAAEDRTGEANSPAYASTDPNAPNYLSYYQDALTASGVSHDVYDVDARGRAAADHLGVLSHYETVIWYSGNDLITREPGWGPGNASRLANDLMLEARSYLNEGGSLLYTGQWAGGLENGVGGTQLYDPVANERCVGPLPDLEILLDRCLTISDKNDFLQYYLGAFLYNSDAGTDPETGEPFPVQGVSDPYSAFGWDLNGADSADNQAHTASFLTTSSLLPPDEYPQFASGAPAIWDRGGTGAAPFEPFDGDRYMYSQRADISFKRLARTIDLTGVSAGDAPSLTFQASYDTEPAWDFLFVEAHTVGEDDWTTLSDENGHTSDDTGASCPAGWHELHPFLRHYQTLVPPDPSDPESEPSCTPTGSEGSPPGEWHASSGRSDGWEEWEVDLSEYAGEEVEISISYASDWQVQGVGAFVDQVEVSTGEGTTSFEDDGDPMDGWTVPGAPEGSDPNPNDWERTGSVGFEEGAVTSTEDTLYFGFGFEGIAGAAARNEAMDRSMGYLLGSP